MRTFLYKRATFVTHLPVDHLYTPSHCWITSIEQGQLRIGYTKFALRMLGELVELQLTVAPESRVETGDVVGSIEGFKAISDIYCVGRGRFVTGNPELGSTLESIGADPYGAGWIYQIAGEPDRQAMNVEGYRALLDETIDRLLEKQRADEETNNG